jgi:hypothetical protein
MGLKTIVNIGKSRGLIKGAVVYEPSPNSMVMMTFKTALVMKRNQGQDLLPFDLRTPFLKFRFFSQKNALYPGLTFASTFNFPFNMRQLKLQMQGVFFNLKYKLCDQTNSNIGFYFYSIFHQAFYYETNLSKNLEVCIAL